jgi:hypothetical protein
MNEWYVIEQMSRLPDKILLKRRQYGIKSLEMFQMQMLTQFDTEIRPHTCGYSRQAKAA